MRFESAHLKTILLRLGVPVTLIAIFVLVGSSYREARRIEYQALSRAMGAAGEVKRALAVLSADLRFAATESGPERESHLAAAEAVRVFEEQLRTLELHLGPTGLTIESATKVESAHLIESVSRLSEPEIKAAVLAPVIEEATVLSDRLGDAVSALIVRLQGSQDENSRRLRVEEWLHSLGLLLLVIVTGLFHLCPRKFGLASGLVQKGEDDAASELTSARDLVYKAEAHAAVSSEIKEMGPGGICPLHIFGPSSEPWLQLDGNGLIDANEAAWKALGCTSLEELLHAHVALFWPPEQADGANSSAAFEAKMQAAHENGSQRFDWRFRTLDGREKEASFSLTSIELAGRKQILLSWHDITSRKQLERRIEERRKFLERVIERLPIALVCASGEAELRYSVWNKKASEIWGLRAEDVLGRTVEELEAERTLGVLSVVQARAMIANGREEIVEEARVVSHENGFARDVRTVMMTIGGVLDEGIASTPPFLVIGEDVTERRRNEREIKVREATLSDAQKLSRIGNFEFDPATGRGFWSPQAAVNMGLPGATDFNFVNWEDLILEEDRGTYREALEACRSGKRILNIEFRVKKAAGAVATIHCYGKPVFERMGECTKVVGTLQDVTEKKRQEQVIRSQEVLIFQSAKMSSLGEMAGGIAHEINNPLAIIQSAAEQLTMRIERGALDEAKAKSLLEKIVATSERIAKIIQGLRTFARDGTKDPLAPRDLREVVEETLEFCRTRFKNHGISFEIALPAEPARVECRPVEISQVVLNLLNNAFDAVETSERRSIRLELKIHQSWCEVRVTDSGPGIPAEIRTRIFQPFFTTKEVGKGTGLGLSISSEILRAHNGTLAIDELADETTFVVHLPRLQAEADHGQQEAA